MAEDGSASTLDTMMITYNQIASVYARHRQVHPEVLLSLLTVVGSDDTSRVLEVGCGTGNYIIALQQQTGCGCWGIDPSEHMLSRARRQSDKVVFQEGRAERINFPRESFDLVFSVDVIHHVGSRLRYFQQAHRVLKPGGGMCTVTDSEEIIRHRQPLATYFLETVVVELSCYPHMGELRRAMTQVGFDRVWEREVAFAYRLTDCQAYSDKAFSSLHLISVEAFQRGISQMERDLRAGPIECVSRYALIWGTK